MTFWDHLDELRGGLVRIVIVVAILAIVAFCFKDALFAIILAPKSDSFITYRIVRQFVPSLPSFHIDLVNIELTQQFLIHVKMSLYAAALLILPYIIYEIFRFVSPGLYKHERRASLQAVSLGYLLFMSGVLLSYFIIFPLTFRFLSAYQVSPEVNNVISLSSYISTFLILIAMMGLLFELPVLCWLLAHIGLLSADTMKHYRRHAIVLIVILAAVITPTGDVFTLTVVSLPIWLLYELSIAIVKRTSRHTT